jgi:hypothetical protein
MPPLAYLPSRIQYAPETNGHSIARFFAGVKRRIGQTVLPGAPLFWARALLLANRKPQGWKVDWDGIAAWPACGKRTVRTPARRAAGGCCWYKSPGPAGG